MHEYDREIFKVLSEAGEQGLKTEKIAHHVFNACNSIFNPVDYSSLHVYVTHFLISHSRSVDSIIEKTDRGVYRINNMVKESQQLMFDFTDETPPKTDVQDEKNDEADYSLSLF